MSVRIYYENIKTNINGAYVQLVPHDDAVCLSRTWIRNYGLTERVIFRYTDKYATRYILMLTRQIILVIYSKQLYFSHSFKNKALNKILIHVNIYYYLG